MPSISTFSNLASRGWRFSQGAAINRNWAAGVGTKTSGTTYTDTVVAQAGDLIIVACSWDPTGNQTPATSAVTDTVSTTYSSMGTLVTAPATTSSGTGLLMQLYWGIVPSGVASSTITVTWTWGGTTVVAKALIAVSFYNVRKDLVVPRSSSVTNTASISSSSGLANVGDLALFVAASENNTIPTGNADATFSTVVGAASTGAGAGTNQAIALQYKIATSRGQISSGWTGLGGNSVVQSYVIKAI